MKEITIVRQSKSRDEISKFSGEWAKITSYGQQLASWGKDIKEGLITNVKYARKMHTVEMLEEGEIREFSANSFQYQYFIIESAHNILFVQNDNQDFTKETISELIAQNIN